MPGIVRRGALAALLLSLVIGGVAAQDADAFEKSWGSIERLMKRGRWKQVKSRIDRLLEDHADQDHARARRAALVSAYERCSFELAHPAPALEELVSGKLLSGRLESGRVKIRYEAGEWDGDWEHVEGILFFQPKMAGPYEVILEGAQYPAMNSRAAYGETGTPTVYAPWDEGYGFLSVFGLPEANVGTQKVSVPARLIRVKGGSQEVVHEEAQTPARPGRKFKLRVRVKQGSVSAICGSKQLFGTSKPKDLWGYLGFSGRNVDAVTIDGTVEPSWLQSRLDARRAERREAFLARWKPEEVLPPWLFARGEPAAAAASLPAWPQPLEARARRQAGRALARARTGLTEKAVEGFQGLPADAVPEPTRGFVLAWLKADLGESTEALALVDRALKQAPDFLRGQLLRARILADLGRHADAGRSLGELASAHPQFEEIHAALVMHHFERAAYDDAEAAVVAGARHHPGSGLLGAAGRMVRKARSGPPWARTFEVRTQHYHVVSDIDRKTCIEAGRILEESYLAYTTTLARPPRSERSTRLFKVYLFAGEAGYADYCKDIMGASAPHTAGLYSPMLKQLLIWNLPERKDMLRTVRHEGWHQYLDSIVDGQPTWFDEGMAEYYETAEHVGGAWQIGRPRPDHLRMLDGTGGKPRPLGEFLRLRHEAFYEDAGVNYAQAWAFIHYLRHRSADTRKRFKRLFEGLLENDSWEVTMKQVFPAAELPALEADFLAHLRSF